MLESGSKKYKRISRNKVFENLAKIGKTTMGWFFGFKLHLIVNDKGDILNFCFAAGNAADVKKLKKLVQDLKGKLFADKAYMNNKLSAELLADGIQLVTPIKSNMKNKFVSMLDKILLRKRSIIETINDQLKNI